MDIKTGLPAVGVLVVITVYAGISTAAWHGAGLAVCLFLLLAGSSADSESLTLLLILILILILLLLLLLYAAYSRCSHTFTRPSLCIAI